MLNEVLMILILLVLVSFFGYLAWDSYRDVKAHTDRSDP